MERAFHWRFWRRRHPASTRISADGTAAALAAVVGQALEQRRPVRVLTEVLEPDGLSLELAVVPIITPMSSTSRQRADRNGELRRLLRALGHPDRSAFAPLALLTSFETYRELRRNAKLSRRDVTSTLQESARRLLR